MGSVLKGSDRERQLIMESEEGDLLAVGITMPINLLSDVAFKLSDGVWTILFVKEISFIPGSTGNNPIS